MKAKLALLSMLALTAGLGVSAQAEPALGGAFNVTFYTEPNLSTGTTFCYQFTTTKDVLGYPVSGTWTVPAYSAADGGTWSGDWYQVGDEIILDSVADSEYVFSYKGSLTYAGRIDGRFTEFDVTGATGSTVAGGTFLGVKITGNCPASGGTVKGGDPMK